MKVEKTLRLNTIERNMSFFHDMSTETDLFFLKAIIRKMPSPCDLDPCDILSNVKWDLSYFVVVILHLSVI